MFGNVCRFLDEDNWRYRVLEEAVIKFGVQGESANFECFADVKSDRNIFLLYVIAPNRPSQDDMIYSDLLLFPLWIATTQG
jgi:hypothetical protein